MSDAQNYSLVPHQREARTVFIVIAFKHHLWVPQTAIKNLHMGYIHPPAHYSGGNQVQIFYFFLFLTNLASVHLQASLLEFLAQASPAAKRPPCSTAPDLCHVAIKCIQRHMADAAPDAAIRSSRLDATLAPSQAVNDSTYHLFNMYMVPLLKSHDSASRTEHQLLN